MGGGGRSRAAQQQLLEGVSPPSLSSAGEPYLCQPNCQPSTALRGNKELKHQGTL